MDVWSVKICPVDFTFHVSQTHACFCIVLNYCRVFTVPIEYRRDDVFFYGNLEVIRTLVTLTESL